MDTRKRWITEVPARQCGKTLKMAEMERDFIIDHPDATIIRHVNGQTIVEKPIDAVEVGLPSLEHKP